MKTLALIAALLTAVTLQAADPPTPPPLAPVTPKDWWSDFSVTPFGSVSHTDFQGKGTWGAGLDVGYYFNRTVSLHISNLGTEEGNWRGKAIDETSLLFQADLIRDSRERFVGFLLGGVDRYWSNPSGNCKGDDSGEWGLGVGGGGEIRLSKNFSFGLDYRVRIREQEEFGSIGRGFFRLRF